MRFLLLLFLLFNAFSSFAQGEANIWYFGNNAGLDFNSSPPSPLLDGQIDTPEGCSTISDANGNLLFYTDGRTVWDSQHNIMPNGDYFGGTGLLGDPSSTQSGLIVPHPLEEDLFYVFTVDEPHHENAYAYPNQGPALPDGTPVDNYQDVPNHTVPEDDDGFNNGLNYSLVDMNLRNGLGNVVQGERNNHLITYNEDDPEEIKYQCSEKITAVAGADCESIWVITHFIDKFYAFKIDEDGLDENPVVSTVAPPVTIANYRRASIGFLKASPDGSKLVSATLTSTYNQQGTSDAGDGHVYLYDFDDATGEVSNSVDLITNVAAYGVEFSPDSKKVYATLDQFIGGNPTTSILQWDLEAPDISQTQYAFPGVNLPSAAAIQLAPDGKIYVSVLGQSKLNVINSPNEAGFEANYSENLATGALGLGGPTATFGLPPFIQSFFTTTVNILPEDAETEVATGNNFVLCSGEEAVFGYEAEGDATYVWYENDEIIENETDPFLSISHQEGNTPSEVVSYRLEIFPASGECKINGLINVNFTEPPNLQETELINCISAENPTNAIFNLNDSIEFLIGEEANLENFEFTFFEDEELVEEIANPNVYETEEEQAEIFVLVEDLSTRCSAVISIELISGFAENLATELEACDEFEEGTGVFDLTELEDQFEDLTTNFYLTEAEALAENNPIENPSEFLSNTTSVYARLQNSEICDELLVIDLRILNLPTTSSNQVVYYCQEDFPNTITLSSGLESDLSNFEFFWLPNGETTPSIEVNEAGEFEVFIQDLTTGCENSRIIEVINSGLTNFELKTTDATNNNSIEVIIPADAPGNYEFALHNASSFQDSPIFEGLEPGDYRVYVRDKNGCGIVAQSTTIIGIMKFFTPNADGINDFWGLRGNRPGVQDRAVISVFDRYGKLLFQFTGADQGWDGNYNGKPMPSNDYWYHVQLEDGRVVKGNFTLKR